MTVTVKNDVIFLENDVISLAVGTDAVTQSIFHKPTGTECLAPGSRKPLFSVTEERPYNNELKLSYPNKRTEFPADRLRWEDGRLIVGFELVSFEAVVSVRDGGSYFAFTLEDFRVPAGVFCANMDTPPVEEFRLLQLPVRDLGTFGQWLNVTFDQAVAVNVLAVSPHARIDALRGDGQIRMTADAVRGIRLKGCTAALIVSGTDAFLDAVEDVENDFGLPRGVKSRRSPEINASIYWAEDATPENLDVHLALAKQGGFRMMLLYYTCIVHETGGYAYCGDYDYRSEYPNGAEDVKAMLRRIKDAGITPGLHVLAPHIGLKSRYATPTADHRLRKKERFTLARPLGETDTTVYVEQNPEFAPMADRCRVLQFGGELISYEGYTTDWPYAFTGCVRGHNDTYPAVHPLGCEGGVLDISEFGGTSTYLDQTTSLQDEVAEKIAAIYNCGFRFLYLDGAEGTNPPFAFHIPNAQYRLYKRLHPAPLFCEGAAKSHFSWHMLSGGNAFDIFPTDIFKAMIVRHPQEEAPRMARDFTRLNFGWWAIYPDTQPDIYEFGTSRAAGWDAPVTIQARPEIFRENPRTADILEVMRRWEDVRARNLLTAEQKQLLRSSEQEHTLLLNGRGEYELVACDRIPTGDDRISAWRFTRSGAEYAAYWHTCGEGTLYLPLAADDIACTEEIDGDAHNTETAENGILLPIGKKRYIKANCPVQTLLDAFRNAKLQ